MAGIEETAMTHSGNTDHNHAHENARHTAADTCCQGKNACVQPMATQQTPKMAGPVFLISNMDCATEEGEIRHALDGMTGIRNLQFHLGERQLVIDADEDTLQEALAAIRKAGFKPKP
jgi:Cd2+/Zn2+-exporting ATPase